MVCARCARPDWPTTVMTDRGHKLLLTLQAIDLRRLGETNLSAGVKAEAQRAIRTFFDAHVEVRIKSRSFLDQLDKL
jgi:DNA repair protein RecO (recombination protein O)